MTWTAAGLDTGLPVWQGATMITNLDSLKQAIAGFLLRDDLTEQIDAFVQLGEAQLNRDIRHPRMEARIEYPHLTRRFPLPSEWLETVSIEFTGQNGEPAFLRPFGSAEAEVVAAREHGSGGDPQGYRVEGNNLIITPAPGAGAASMVFVAKLASVLDPSHGNTNWLLRRYPDAYLYGSLMHSAPFLMEDNRLAMWGDLYAAAVGKVNRVGKQSRLAGARLRVRNRGIPFGHQVR